MQATSKEDKIVTRVIDAGGRFGLHPTWKPFKAELAYYLFEPDTNEASRLRKKYSGRRDVIIESKGLSDKKGKIELNLLRNPAMSTSCVRKPISPLFWKERKDQEDVVATIHVDCNSIDDYCKENEIQADFLKLDTEGSELQVLHGAKEQIKSNVLGVRCEISFGEVFEGGAHFSDVNKFLSESGFFLLNLDYDGRGDFLNDYVQISGRYGVLLSCDGVWMKKSPASYGNDNSVSASIQTLKYAAFCLNNNAPDLAIHVLLEGRKKHGVSFSGLDGTQLLKQVDLELHRHFYRLKWQPGQSLAKHYEIFESIFDKPMLRVQEYNESIDLNPD